MTEQEHIPALKEIIGALLFGAKKPLSIPQIKTVLSKAHDHFGGITESYSEVKESEISKVLNKLAEELNSQPNGLNISEVAGGFRLQNDLRCGPWLRELLDRGKPASLSRPALETLAIIAYRQPCMRSEIESVRGVSVDAIVRNLIELQLIRVMGRSELPGKPWLFGTTSTFLEHFGLNNLEELPGMEELKRRDEERLKATEESAGDEDED